MQVCFSSFRAVFWGLYFLSSFSQVQAEVSYTPISAYGWPHQLGGCDKFVMAPGDVVIDHLNTDGLPKKFRAAPDWYFNEDINLKGFRDLRISGSIQFSQKQFESILKHLTQKHLIAPKDIVLVDLRQEMHGFINGAAVTLHGGPLGQDLDASVDEIRAREKNRFAGLLGQKNLPLYHVIKSPDGFVSKKSPVLTDVAVVQTEGDLAQQYGVRYVRIPVTDHFKPENREIDDFLKLLQTIEPSAWLHFHCRGGSGRTTTFMTFYDIIKNPDVSLADILNRQKLAKGADLNNINRPRSKEWMENAAKERLVVIQRFYAYVHDQQGYGKMTWSAWSEKKYPQGMSISIAEKMQHHR